MAIGMPGYRDARLSARLSECPVIRMRDERSGLHPAVLGQSGTARSGPGNPGPNSSAGASSGRCGGLFRGAARTAAHSAAAGVRRGLDYLDEATAARLALFAALHDIGKVNVGFQARIWQPADYPPGQRKPRWAGHTLDLQPVLNGDDSATNKRFFDALGWWNEAVTWDADDGETVCALLIAALSHHGKPLPLEGDRGPNRRFGALSAASIRWRKCGVSANWPAAGFRRPSPPAPRPCRRPPLFSTTSSAYATWPTGLAPTNNGFLI